MEGRAELKRKLDQATWHLKNVGDATTKRHLRELVRELERVVEIAADREDLNRERERAMSELNQAIIRARAFEIWEEAGQPSGRHEEFWLAAEREMQGDPVKHGLALDGDPGVARQSGWEARQSRWQFSGRGVGMIVAA
jgi:hypothetical protein